MGRKRVRGCLPRCAHAPGGSGSSETTPSSLGLSPSRHVGTRRPMPVCGGPCTQVGLLMPRPRGGGLLASSGPPWVLKELGMLVTSVRNEQGRFGEMDVSG